MSPPSLTAVPCDPPAGHGNLGNLVGLKLGNYRLERLLGRGRMGVVYLATDEALLRPTAVKVLSWSIADAGGHDPVQWFLAEARTVARINHPRVVQIYGAARHGEHCYLAMEYVPGPSAEALVAGGKPLAPALATEILLQATSALRAAHRSGVIHRDVKPANLLLGEGGVTKLGDFGMALGPAEVRAGNANLRVGTPYYTAPEIWRGEAATAASDLYSLGATYFHLLTGRPPYPGADLAAVERGHLLAAPPDPRELVPGLADSCAALVHRALAKSPRERHASAQELLWEASRVLRELASGHSAAPRSPSRAVHASPAPVPELPAAAGPLAEGLGFARQPFSDVDPAAHPRLCEPLAVARGRFLLALQDEATCAIAVTGPPGSGRASLCRHLSTELGRSRLVLHVAEGPPAGRTLLQRLRGAVGAAESADDEDLEALVLRLGEERERQGALPLVVLDGALPRRPSAEVASLARAAVWTRSFQLLLRGPPGLAMELAAAGLGARPDGLREVAVPPLDGEHLSRHLRAWLESTLAPEAPPILVTPDALRLVVLRSEGALARVDCIAANMLWLAAAERRRTLSTWHAWTAPDRERWSDAGSPAALPRRPEGWPPPEVVDAIDACRRAASVPPWPRPRTPQP
jgi:hypothetical protein